MLDSDSTAVLGRRAIAYVVDALLVLAPAFGVAYMRSESFRIVGRDPLGAPLIDPDEFQRYENLLGFDLNGIGSLVGFDPVRATEMGGNLRVFGAASWRWGLLVGGLLTLLTFLVLPILRSSTVGMLLTGLRITDLEGQPLAPLGHIARLVGGAADAFPWVIPGLLGFGLMFRSRRNQRLGDRLAGSVVIHHSTQPAPSVDLGSRMRIDTERVAAPIPGPTAPGPVIDDEPTPPAAAHPPAVDVDPVVDFVPAATPSADPLVPADDGPLVGFGLGEDDTLVGFDAIPAAEPPAPASDDSSRPTHPASSLPPFTPHDDDAPAGAPDDEFTGGGLLDDDDDRWSAFDPDPGVGTPPGGDHDGADPLLTGEVIDVDRSDVEQFPPPPSHRGRAAAVADDPEPVLDDTTPSDAISDDARIGDTTDTEAALSDTALSDTALSDTALSDTALSDTALSEAAPSDTEPPDASVPAPGDDARPSTRNRPSWARPEAEPAPVWRPEELDPGPIELLDDHSRGIETVSGGDHALGDLLRREEPESASSTADPDDTAESAAGGSASEPVWSEKWNAWMYYDGARERWLRHDAASGQWVPVG